VNKLIVEQSVEYTVSEIDISQNKSVNEISANKNSNKISGSIDESNEKNKDDIEDKNTIHQKRRIEKKLKNKTQR
jgi:hypothetical protein